MQDAEHGSSTNRNGSQDHCFDDGREWRVFAADGVDSQDRSHAWAQQMHNLSLEESRLWGAGILKIGRNAL